MIPFSDSPPARRSTPFVMVALVVANVLVYLYEALLAPDLNQLILNYGTVPYEITHGQGLITLFTSMFLHANLLHIGGNMIFLWVFGDNVEDMLGHARFAAFYFICGVVAALAQVAISPDSTIPSIGASGAISGVLAAYVLLFPGAQVRTLLFIGIFFTITRLRAIFLIGFWIVYQFVLGFISLGGAASSGGVAYFAHMGGFIFGLIFTTAVRKLNLMARS